MNTSQTYREVNAEAYKPESSVLLAYRLYAGAAPYRSLDEAEGCEPDYNTHPTSSINTKTVGRPTQACQENQA